MPTMPMRAKTAAEPQATDWKKPTKSWAKSMIGLWGQREAEATLLKTNSVRLPADIQLAELRFRGPAFFRWNVRKIWFLQDAKIRICVCNH